MYPKISNNLTEFIPTNKYVDFFFSFWCFNGEICYCASKHTHAICWVRGRQFLRTIKFSSGCSVRESHSPPSCEKKEILFILFSPSFSLSPWYQSLSVTALSFASPRSPHTLVLFFFACYLALTILPISISFGGLVKYGLADTTFSEGDLLTWLGGNVPWQKRRKRKLKQKEATQKRPFFLRGRVSYILVAKWVVQNEVEKELHSKCSSVNTMEWPWYDFS